MSPRSTGDLMEELMSASSFSAYMKANRPSMLDGTVARQIGLLLEQKSLRKSDVAKASGLNEIYAYQILAGTRVPTRDKFLCLCIAMELTVEEIQSLLKRCGYAQLYPRRRRDAAILFALRERRDVLAVNEALFICGEATLC